MPVPRAVMDTNVLVSSLRSQLGASFELMRLLRAGQWRLLLSNQVFLEYEEVLKREATALGISLADVDRLLDAIGLLAEEHQPTSVWRIHLTDPDDEAFVRLAWEAQADLLTTHNVRHFAPATEMGIRVLRPVEFLNLLRNSP